MKIEKIERVQDGVIWGSTDIHIEITKEESDELRAALAVVRKYEKAALQEITLKNKYNPAKESDWCEISYATKNDRVIVNIRDGMAG